MINMQKLVVGGLMAASIFLAAPSLAIEAESLSAEETASPEYTVRPPRDFADVKLRSGASSQSVAANPINGNVFLAAYTAGGSCWVRTSTNAGKTWGGAKKLPMAGKPNCGNAVVTWAPDGSRVYAAYSYRIIDQWRETKETGALVSSSTDRGLTWSTPRIAAKYGEYLYLYSLEISTPLTAGDARWVYLLVTWFPEDDDIVDFVRSGDRGQTWASPRRLAGSDNLEGVLNASVAGGRGGDALVAWSFYGCYDDPCRYEIQVTRSGDHGATFQRPISAVPDTFGPSSVAFGAGGTAHLVYTVDYYQGTPGTYYVYSTKAPYTTWSVPVRLNDDLSASNNSRPALTVSACGSGASVLHAAWLDDRAGSDRVYYTRKVAKTGERWSANLPVSPISPISDTGPPRLAAGTGTAVGIWGRGDGLWASRIAPGVSCP